MTDVELEDKLAHKINDMIKVLPDEGKKVRFLYNIGRYSLGQYEHMNYHDAKDIVKESHVLPDYVKIIQLR
jgi:uncharacterized protein YeeX (DUF496 family)